MLLLILSGLFHALSGQAPLTRIYDYDAAGNRIKRSVLVLESSSVPVQRNKPAQTADPDNDPAYYTDRIGDMTIRVFPNPTASRLTIHVQEEEFLETGELRLFSMDGKLLQIYRMEAPQMEIDLSGYAPAVYLLRLKMNDFKNEWKIIKK